MVMRALFTTVFVFATLAVGSIDASAQHSWGSYHWARKTTGEFTLRIGNNMTAPWQSHFTTATADWGTGAYGSPLRTAAVPGTAKGSCRPVTGTVQVCNDRYGTNGWLGLAQIWLKGGHIYQGTAKMNDTYFDLPAYDLAPEKLHVVCQEIGHTFGLGHTSEDGSSQNTCMDYYRNSSATDWTSTRPNPHDYEMLKAMYAHADSTSTIATRAATTPGTGLGSGFAPDGTPAGASPTRGRVYVTGLPGGVMVVTFITWAN